MIRAFRADDFPRLYQANQASVPGVGTETEESLQKWIDMATCLVATDADDNALGFVTVMEIGQQDYDSANMRWFEHYAEKTGKSVVYVDRIALAPDARGQRLGEALYEAAFEKISTADEIGCEVNTLPPNPGSHRFHQRLGFEAIGDRSYADGEKSVRYYVRSLG